MSDPETPRPCPVEGCTEERVNVGQLAHHLRDDHGKDAWSAIAMARGESAAVTASVTADPITPERRAAAIADPYGLEKNGIKTHVPNPTAEGESKRPEQGQSSSPRPDGVAAGDGRDGGDPARVERRSVARRERRGPASPSSSSTRPPKEPAMSTLDQPIPCKGCKKPFVRKHPREGYCADCAAKSGQCTRCRRKYGQHAAKCPNAGAGGKKSPPAPGGAKRSAKPKPAAAPASVRNGSGSIAAAREALQAERDVKAAELARLDNVLEALANL